MSIEEEIHLTLNSKLDPMFRSDWKPTKRYKRETYWASTYSEEWIERITADQMSGWFDPEANLGPTRDDQ